MVESDREGVATRKVTARLIQLGLKPTGGTPEALAAIMAVDTARWSPIIQASGFSGE